MSQAPNEFYYFDGESAIGPHTPRELHSLYQEGVINDTTPILRAGTQDWHPLALYLAASKNVQRPTPKPVVPTEVRPTTETPGIESATWSDRVKESIGMGVALLERRLAAEKSGI